MCFGNLGNKQESIPRPKSAYQRFCEDTVCAVVRDTAGITNEETLQQLLARCSGAAHYATLIALVGDLTPFHLSI